MTDVVDFGNEADKSDEDDGADEAAPLGVRAGLGLRVSDLSDGDRAQLHIKGGVRVESVEGPAERAGLAEGDVVLAIDNIAVTSAKQFAATVERLDKSKTINVLVRRGDAATYLLIRPASK